LAHGKEATLVMQRRTAKYLPCSIGEVHGKEAFTVNGITV
jgi:hypothetical protein